MDKMTEVNEWLEIANQDLNSAIFLKKMEPVPFEIICFHCQQSAEKYLKAFLVFKNINFPKTHDLITILKLCIAINPKFIRIKTNCIRLSEYAVEIRYPYKLQLDKNLTDLAINDARLIKELIILNLKNNK